MSAGHVIRVAALATLLALVWGAAPASAQKTQTQAFFEQRLLADGQTSKAIKTLLQSGGGFVDRNVVFRDLTGDKRDDAVVRVHSGGAAGVVALYVLSAHGTRRGRLRVVFHSQSLYRARTKVTGAVLTVAQPDYARGDDLCCPSARIDRDYTWEEDRRRLLHRATRAIDLVG